VQNNAEPALSAIVTATIVQADLKINGPTVGQDTAGHMLEVIHTKKWLCELGVVYMWTEDGPVSLSVFDVIWGWAQHLYVEC
jgi:hypothetical protein